MQSGASIESNVMQDAETLRMLKRRTMVLSLILAPAIVLTVICVVTQKRAMPSADLAARAIPAFLTHGGVTWTSSSIKLSEEEMQILETRDYVFRTYSDGRGSPVDLCVVFSEDNRKGTHPPDICLEGSGARIVQRPEREVDVEGTKLPVQELIANIGGDRYMYFAYFYKCGETFTPSFYKQQMQIVWNGLTRQNAAGALIRYSTPMTNMTDVEGARARVDALVAATFPHIRDKLNPTQ